MDDIGGCEGYACDPSASSLRCPVEKNGAKLYCHACNLFGMTGLRRQFKINIKGGEQIYPQKSKNKNGFINMRPFHVNSKNGWFLGSGIVDKLNGPPPRKFPITLTVTFLGREEQKMKDTVEVMLYFINKWVGLGAKQQHGYGIVDILSSVNSDDVPIKIDQTGPQGEKKVNNFFNFINPNNKKIAKEIEPRNSLPSLSDFFFAKFQLDNLPADWRDNIDGHPVERPGSDYYHTWHKNHNSAILAASLKNQLRFVHFKNQRDNQEELFGTVWNEKRAANVYISHAYLNNNNKFEVRVWGMVKGANLKGQLYDALHNQTFWREAIKCINATVSCFEWRELNGKNTKRCTKECTSACTDGKAFFRCLLS